MMTRLALALLLLLSPVIAKGQEKPKSPPDHGRVLSCALDVFPHNLKDTTNLADTKNYVFRGKVISLGKDRKVHICYDTEHMRVAGAWVGKPLAFTADKNMGPTVEGDMLFSTKAGPGWANPRAAHDSKRWADPREGKEGPLPRDWVHYKGLYVHGDKVVLSYTVGEMDVLEMPGFVEKDGIIGITRTFQVKADVKSSVVLLRGPHNERKGTLRIGKWAIFGGGKDAYIVGVKGFGDEKIMRFDSNRGLMADIPAMPKGGTFRSFDARAS